MVVAAMQGKRRKQLQIDDDDDIEFTVLGQDITTFQQQRQRGQAATSNHQRSNRNEDVARQSGGSSGQQQHTHVHNQQVRPLQDRWCLEPAAWACSHLPRTVLPNTLMQSLVCRHL